MAYQIDRDEKMSLWERCYLPEIIRGLITTARHFFRNLIHMDERITVEFPEVKKNLPPGYRAEHRLLLRPDGSIRCTACMLCATACPANCISIEAEEVSDPNIESRAKSFVIDELRCVFCGLCVEACPCDAIRMDTGRYENSAFHRKTLLYDREKLVSNAAPGQSPLSGAL